MARLLTLGHSNRELPELLDLVEAAGVRCLVDVRRYPSSRRHPHFRSDALAEALAGRGIRYVHEPELGGHRAPRPDSPHVALRADALRGYADHMAGPGFGAALSRLTALLRAAPTAVMCAERDPRDCHRRLLSDALLARGIEVLHLVDARPPLAHALSPEARIQAGTLRYDRGVQPGLFESP